MAELLVRVNVPSGHTYSNNDVVAVMPDNHTWGAGELDTNIFRIVSLPGSVDELKYLLEEDRGSPIDSMPPAFKKDPKLFLKYLLGVGETIESTVINKRRYKIENNKVFDKRSI